MKGLPWWAVTALGLIGGWAGLVGYVWKWVLDNEEKVIDWAIAKIEANPSANAWLKDPQNQQRLNALLDKAVAEIKKDEPKA